MDITSERNLIDLVVNEAHLLDTQRYDEWQALFTEDGEYWIPLQGVRQQDATSHNSIAHEDRMLLRLRIECLNNPRAHSQHPRSSCQHILQQPVVELSDTASNCHILRTPFLYIETRGEQQILLAGSAQHTLMVVEGRIRIRQKRINLLNSQAALPAIQLFI
jgi:3-phenylpropionate/cinnamic acid dioxygenase small subunit